MDSSNNDEMNITQKIEKNNKLLNLYNDYIKEKIGGKKGVISNCNETKKKIDMINEGYKKKSKEMLKKTTDYDTIINDNEVELKKYIIKKNDCYIRRKEELENYCVQLEILVYYIEEIKYYDKTVKSDNENKQFIDFKNTDTKILEKYKPETDEIIKKLIKTKKELNIMLRPEDGIFKKMLDTANAELEKKYLLNPMFKKILDYALEKKDKKRPNIGNKVSDDKEKDKYKQIFKENIIEQIIYIKNELNSLLEKINSSKTVKSTINKILKYCTETIENIEKAKEINLNEFQKTKITKNINKIKHGMIYILSNDEILKIFSNDKDYKIFREYLKKIETSKNESGTDIKITTYRNLKIAIELLEQSFQTIYILLGDLQCKEKDNDKCYDLDTDLQFKHKYMKYKAKYINYRKINEY